MNLLQSFETLTNRFNLQRRRKILGPTVEKIAEEYIIYCCAASKRSTGSTYATVLKCHILPVFGKRPIESIQWEEISDFLYTKACPESGEGLSGSTLRLISCVLRALFRYAENRGCSVAAWENIRPPALNSSEIHVLSQSEQECLRNYLCYRPDGIKLGVLLCMYTGLRIGEICALKWEDVNFKSATLSVQRTVLRIKNLDWHEGETRTKVIFDAPKSRSGLRCIPLPKFLLDILRPLRRDNDCFLLTGLPGSFMEPRTLQNHYRRILQDAGVEYVNFHALRHTFATNCVNLGFDVKSLSEILGHSSVNVTLNTYVHPSISVMRSYMELLQ